MNDSNGKTYLQTQVVTLRPEDLKNLISDAVNAGLGSYQISCPVPEEIQKQMSHTFGMVKDIGGDGTIEKGIELIRSNHTFTRKLRDITEKVTIKVIMTLVVALLTSMGGLLYLGASMMKVG